MLDYGRFSKIGQAIYNNNIATRMSENFLKSNNAVINQISLLARVVKEQILTQVYFWLALYMHVFKAQIAFIAFCQKAFKLSNYFTRLEHRRESVQDRTLRKTWISLQ